MRALVPLLLIAGLAALGPPASAQPTDVWVDPVAGDDTNSGSSPIEALRTLTRALEVTTGSVPSDTIWLLPGTFSSSSGA